MTGGTFISYRREDSAGFAGRLADSLERALPDEPVFRDVDGLAPGEDFVAAIESRLRQCRFCVAVIGRAWLTVRDAAGRRRLDDPEDFVRLELATALSRPDVVVVPLLVDGATMPRAEDLPDVLRPLARRHAMSVRDDSWDADLSRLIARIRGATPGGAPPQLNTPGAPGAPPAARRAGGMPAWAVLAGLLVVGLFIYWRPGGGAPPAPAESTPDAGADAASGASASAAAPLPTDAASGGDTAASTAGRPLAVPRLSQVAAKDLIYTLIGGRVRTQSPDTRLVVLRVAVENGSGYPANFWDDTFRLSWDGETVAPVGGLNRVVAGNTTAEDNVEFRLPADATKVLLRIRARDVEAVVPLDLESAPAGPGGDGTRGPVVTTLVDTPRPVLTAPVVTVVMTKLTTRRFANLLRVNLDLRFSSSTGFTLFDNTLPMRLVVGDDVLTPTEAPSADIKSGATARLGVTFDVPPDTTRTVLRASVRDTNVAVEVPLELR